MKWQWWLLSALLIRLCAAALFFIGPSSDAADYERLGASLAAGAGFSNPDGSPASWRAPGYPAFIAAVYSLAGRWPRAVALAQALLDTGTCLLLWWWARRRLGEEVARWVLPLAAVSLSMVASVRLLNSECLASFLTVSTCASLDAVNRTGISGGSETRKDWSHGKTKQVPAGTEGASRTTGA